MAFSEEGEKTGSLLAKIAKSHQSSPAIGAICSSDGCIVNSLEQVTRELATFYATLYQSPSQYSTKNPKI